jgi:hypothetical protein
MNKLVAIVALGVVLTACGSSDGDSTVTLAPDATTAVTAAATAVPTSAAPAETTTTTVATTTSTTAVPVDVTPPDLVVAYPPDGATVADADVEFGGTVEPGVAGVWALPDNAATVDADGNWSVVVSLESGDNTTSFSALDLAGNESVIDRTVRYTAPMPCDGMSIDPEHVSAFPPGPKDWCGGWGYIVSADTSQIAFDLAQVDLTVAGDESQGWSIVNNNPMLRYLPLSSAIEVRACPPVSGGTAPGICGSPWVGPESWEFSLWTPTELAGFVAASDELWRVMVDTSGEVVWVEQWWTP